MALAKTQCVSFEGVSALMVGVEANIGQGLPGMYVVGLAGAAMSEAKDRLKTAMVNAGLPWPKTKLIVNLSPADLRKSGSQFDLAICAAVMSATLGVRVDDTMFLGEVGLDGAIKPVPGILPALLAAREHGIQTIVVPAGNEAEAGALPDITVMTASHISEVADWMLGHRPLQRALGVEQMIEQHPDMADVVGQQEAKLAAEVAAAGGHHLLMIGPPGSGKSMIAARIPGILPPLTTAESIESSAIHSMRGTGLSGLLSSAPFVAPHHSVSSAVLIGGGSGRPKPGAVSLAHHGCCSWMKRVKYRPTFLIACGFQWKAARSDCCGDNGRSYFRRNFNWCLRRIRAGVAARNQRNVLVPPRQGAVTSVIFRGR